MLPGRSAPRNHVAPSRKPEAPEKAPARSEALTAPASVTGPGVLALPVPHPGLHLPLLLCPPGGRGGGSPSVPTPTLASHPSPLSGRVGREHPAGSIPSAERLLPLCAGSSLSGRVYRRQSSCNPTLSQAPGALLALESPD